ncbi:SDR family NAD(P)-dependent oxidoreductase [Flavobacterium agricola]|uniref:SDR family NAD(P)-dependent oxidoreductase n=1 Tax=Flavobacterium agricola TaxID=2870839 RepID=A0ABY6LYP4_9FLAO|nr:SDR family NAD(P)-dependent oxidoreductase [Flavobacterium agricola]UYW01447.1 SDR family NAD(P)-dependent oxidoreductase [Flavobacterium agricola]
MKIALITGATSGIGLATAKKIAPKYKLILCGRRTEKLAEVAAQLSKITQVHTLSFDVANKDAVFNAITNLPNEWKNIEVLINNAGNAHGLASFQDAELDDLEAMIDINVKGLMYVTKAVLPYLLQQKSGHIINLSSIAGKQVYANGATYCASKWAVEALTKGMRLDLLPHGIKVTAVAPGAVDTEFSLVRFKGDAAKAADVYKGYEPLVGEDIAETIAFVLDQPEHVQIADITVFPKAQGDGRTFYRE